MTAMCGWPALISRRQHRNKLGVFPLTIAKTARETGRFFNFETKIRYLGRILAIDYGTKRTGLAVTDPGQIIASPLKTVPSHELMNYLESYFGKEDVETLVVGKPTKMDGSDSESMKPLQFFVQAFRKRFPGVRVEWMDERFTSKLAMDAMVAGGMKKSDRRVKGNVDKVSAALILQFWMERENNLRR